MTDYNGKVFNKGIEYELFEALRKNNMSYIYRGEFTPEITETILNLVELGFIKSSDLKAVKRKIYHIMVEGLQNIVKHQADPDDLGCNVQGIFILKRESDKYLFTTCNIIESEDSKKISNQIEHVNGLERDELKDYYKKVLVDGTLSAKGGAGLGLIDMCLKSGNKLAYSFEKYDDTRSLFYFHSEVASTKKTQSQHLANPAKWDEEKQLHKKLIANNILFIFNNHFSQESMISLLTMIESQMSGKILLKKRMYSVIVEMMQNIIKHADDYESTEDGKVGLFYISEKDGVYTLHSGNYIKNEDVEIFKNRIDFVNSLSEENLEKEYTKQLLNNHGITNEASGLGIIELKLKAQSQLDLDIFKVDSELSFCVLRANLR